MGKSLQPQKATAVRQPANTPAAAGPAAVPASNEPATAESLGWQLRAALPPVRLHSVSLWDEQANTLWLSEGALGPDEHNVVLEAIEALSNDTSSNCYETGIEYGPAAIFLPVRSPVGGLVGLAMILADIKSVNDGVLEKLEAMLRDAGASPPILSELQTRLGVGNRFAGFLGLLEEKSAVVRVGDGLYYHTAALGAIETKLREHLATHPVMAMADFKDLTGLSRKYAVPLLEYFDRKGVTARQGDNRIPGPRLRHTS